MSRKRHAAVVLMVALLAAFHAPAAVGQTGGTLVVGSQHTTATDFNNADTLRHFTVEGSGDSASVTYESGSGTLIDDFDDGDTTIENASWSGWDGDTGAISTCSPNYDDAPEPPSLCLEAVSGDVNTTYADNGENTAQAVGIDWFNTAGMSSSHSNVSLVKSGGGESLVTLNFTTTSEGEVIELEWGSNETQIGTWNIAETKRVVFYPKPSTGEVNIFLDGSLAASPNVGDVSWGRVTTTVDSTDSTFANEVTIDNLRLYKPVDGTYVSSNHSVSNAEEAFVNLSVQNDSSATVTWEYYQDGGWKTANRTTYTTGGNKTVQLSETATDWRVNVTADGGSPYQNSSVSVFDDGVLFDNDAPIVENSSSSPTGDISQKDIELSIEVSDPQLSSAQGDELTATFYVEGETVGTDTLTSNGTASVPYTAETGGSQSWHVVVTDSYGSSTTSDTFEFRAPSTLEIRNESAPTKLVDNATVTLQFYGNESTDNPITVTRTVTDGTANMTGLPIGQPLVVVASADGYHDRRIFLNSLYDQQEIYLLPSSEPVVQPTYVLEDFSGYYSQENSVLIIQREINGSYQTVVGDYFGATGGFEATLEEGVRHRLVIMNTKTGRSRVLGTTMATDDAEKLIRVLNDEEIELVDEGDRSPTVGPTLSTLPASTTEISITTYANDSQTYDITITYQNDSVTDTLTTGSIGGNTEEAFNIDLSDRSKGSVWVNISWTTVDGNSATKSVEYSVEKVYVGDQSLLDWISYVPGEFGPNTGAVTSFISVLLTVLLTGVVAQTNRPSGQVLGLVALASMSSFAVIGWLSYDVLFASAVGYFGLIAIREGL